MFRLTVKHYRRHFEGDNYYTIEVVYCYDYQLGNWLAKPSTWDYELLSYKHVD